MSCIWYKKNVNNNFNNTMELHYENIKKADSYRKKFDLFIRQTLI